MASEAQQAEAVELFEKISAHTGPKSLLQQHLTRELIDKLKHRTTPQGGTLADSIKSGCLNPDSQCGLYATDDASFLTFPELFDPVVKDYHKIPQDKPITHPKHDFGDVENYDFENLHLEKDLIISTRVRVGRSIKGYGWPPVYKSGTRKEIESKIMEGLNSLEGELKGTYYPLSEMSADMQKQLTADHFLFRDDSKFRKVIRGYEDWPHNRGIYFTEKKNFLMWINEGDHLRIISMQNGSDLKAVYKRLVDGANAMEKKVTFATDERMGYVTFCPTNLGTAMRASVHIRIPHLSAHSEEFQAVCAKHNLQPRGIHGEHTQSVGGVYDISNKRRLGLTEFEAVKEMAVGVKEIIKLEKEFAAKA